MAPHLTGQGSRHVRPVVPHARRVALTTKTPRATHAVVDVTAIAEHTGGGSKASGALKARDGT
jgi:hypothetical protein